LAWQIAECHHRIDKELDAGTERPARLTLLKSKLESLMELLKREDAQKERGANTIPTDPQKTTNPTVEELESLLKKCEAEEAQKKLDATVVKMMTAFHAPRTETASVTPAPVTVSVQTSPLLHVRDTSTVDDPDLLV
jgi:hypothetical protein